MRKDCGRPRRRRWGGLWGCSRCCPAAARGPPPAPGRGGGRTARLVLVGAVVVLSFPGPAAASAGAARALDRTAEACGVGSRAARALLRLRGVV